ncbi:MAG: hypothetical protein ACTSX7_11325 [Alphaproteobacteria bacterium]
MSWLTFSAFCLVLIVMLLVLFRVFGRSGIQTLSVATMQGDMAEAMKSARSGAIGGAYTEVLNLANYKLAKGEHVLAACGRREETETVLLATNQQLLLLTRRYGSSAYHKEVFEYEKLHPIPISQAAAGERIRLLDGSRIGEMKSPGDQSWMDSPEEMIKVINEQIREAQR